MDENPKPQSSWWQTLPGVLTAGALAITAIATLIGALHQAGLFGGGDEKKSSEVKEVITSPKANAETRQSCSARAGYPMGRWAINAKSTSSAEFASFITFTRSNGGTWLPNTGQGSFEAIPTPSPGTEVVIRFRPGSGNYSSTNKLVVSSDGC
jgi:hypothetical protein